MMGWSRYLHQEAVEAGYEILDTGLVPLPESVERIVSYLCERHDSGAVI